MGEMFDELSDSHRLAWFILYAHAKAYGRAGRFTIDYRTMRMTHRWQGTADDLERLIEAAIRFGRLKRHPDGVLEMVGWDITQSRRSRRGGESGVCAESGATHASGEVGECAPHHSPSTSHPSPSTPHQSPAPMRPSSARADSLPHSDGRGKSKRAKQSDGRMGASPSPEAQRWRDRLAEIDLSTKTPVLALEALGVDPPEARRLAGVYEPRRIIAACQAVRERVLSADSEPVENPAGMVHTWLTGASHDAEITPAGRFARTVAGTRKSRIDSAQLGKSMHSPRRRLDDADADAPHECGAIVHANGQARPP